MRVYRTYQINSSYFPSPFKSRPNLSNLDIYTKLQMIEETQVEQLVVGKQKNLQ